MINISELKTGQKVYYQPAQYELSDNWENGLIKEIPEWSIDSVRVVYNCAGNWKDYKNYTSALTNVRDLHLGWKTQIQLDIFQGREKRDTGIAQSVNNANRRNEYWSICAYYFLLQYIRTHSEFMAEEVRAASMGHVPQPPSNRAWGAIFVRAKRSGKIKRKDYKPVSNPKAHCTPATLWEVIN